MLKTELIPLNYDLAFTSIFNKEENIIILENFISTYLEIPLKEIKGNLKLLNRDLKKENKKESKKEVDLLLNYRGKKINIELSNKVSQGTIDRNVVYVCNIHSKQLKKGDRDYSHINETIQINLNNFRCNEEIRESYYLRNEKGKILSKKLRIDTVDMVKAKEICYTKDETKLTRWCKILTSTSEEEIRMIMGDDLMEKESKEKLLEEMNEFSDDEENIFLYTTLPRSEMEQNTYIYEAREEGYNDGFNNGFNDGFNDGILDGKKQMVINMLKKNIDVNTISEISGMTIKEINNIK